MERNWPILPKFAPRPVACEEQSESLAPQRIERGRCDAIAGNDTGCDDTAHGLPAHCGAAAAILVSEEFAKKHGCAQM